jgi:hypothetical protein
MKGIRKLGNGKQYNNILVLFDAENIQLKKWYRGAKFAIMGETGKWKWDLSYKVAIYCQNHSKIAIGNGNTNVRHIILPPTNKKEAADNKILQIIKENTKRKIFLVTNDKRLYLQAIEIREDICIVYNSNELKINSTNKLKIRKDDE